MGLENLKKGLYILKTPDKTVADYLRVYLGDKRCSTLFCCKRILTGLELNINQQ